MKPFFAIILFFSTLPIFAQQKIIDVRNLAEGTIVTVSGIVTNGSELGVIRYLQDNTAGLGVYDNSLADVKRGDSITVTGKVKFHKNLFEISDVSELIIHSSNNQLPEPATININEIGESYEGQLVKLNNITIDNSSGAFSEKRNYTFTDGVNSGTLKVNIYSPLTGQPISSNAVNLIAICSQFSNTPGDIQSGYQLLPRDMDDLISDYPVNIISVPTAKKITTSGFTISWRTDVDATPKIMFGTSPDPESWINFAEGNPTPAGDAFNQEVTVTGLEPAAIVYAQCFSIFNNDTASFAMQAYATQSLSTGKINVFFNTPADTSVATGAHAMDIGTLMEDTLIAYINRAEETIDFCIYNINNNGISNVANALNAATQRGVQVRVITCGHTNHLGIDDLLPSIPVLERPDIKDSGIMHNKFVIFDASSSDPHKPWVWTGSLNLSYNQVNTDAQNILFIQDQALAKTYEIEFEEMWGSNGFSPNVTLAKFGADKTDNTPHLLLIDTTYIECYFSPSDGTNKKIMDALNSANNDLSVETMLITRTDLAMAIAEAQQRGVEVEVITNYFQNNSATVNDLLHSSLPQRKFVDDEQTPGLMHNKFAIIDANFTVSDPQVVTGSHNWSKSANTTNDENTLIIHNAEIANLYFQQFAQRFKTNGGDFYVFAESLPVFDIKVYPNPTNGLLSISGSGSGRIQNISLFSGNGILLYQFGDIVSGTKNINLQYLPAGLYILKAENENGKTTTFKIVKK
ncbi:MAG: hypothetical protein CSA36_06460 [Draconibacterium sp.]|nr:MAG: hypothetical protein CSA36_06460 [Draconibacterium sp.]